MKFVPVYRFILNNLNKNKNVKYLHISSDFMSIIIINVVLMSSSLGIWCAPLPPLLLSKVWKGLFRYFGNYGRYQNWLYARLLNVKNNKLRQNNSWIYSKSLSICLSIYLSICLSVYLSIYLYICLSINLSIYTTI